MVGHRADPTSIKDFSRPIAYQAQGQRIKGGRRAIVVAFPEPLLDQVRAEAIKRGWSVSRMVRHLCEASIEGIE